ncbi:uncharacterized protein LOC133890267 [Phragmites australis]|uniref:uncharacterized protein LOC133890267 n=1 Tax=Phragmites australis TaxID=29695 RepID=UPI002D7977D2|nr:uncharacterized protein LOC133890267 [Phragmites australis]
MKMSPRVFWVCAVSGEPQASGGAAASSSRRTEGGGTADDGVAVAPEDRGKCPQLYIPVLESPPSPSAVAVFPVMEPRLVRMGPPSSATEARGAPAPAPAPEPSRPAEPGQADVAMEAGTTEAATVSGPADAAAVMGPADAAAEAGTQPSPEHLAPVEPTPGVPSPGWMMALQVLGSPTPPEEARGEPSAQPAPGQPTDPLPVAIESVRVAVKRLGAAVDVELAQLEAERARLDAERARLTTAWRSFEARLVVARTTNEEEQSAMDESHVTVMEEEFACFQDQKFKDLA